MNEGNPPNEAIEVLERVVDDRIETDVQPKLKAVRSEVNKLRKELDALRTEQQNARSITEKTHNETLNGIIGLVSRLEVDLLFTQRTLASTIAKLALVDAGSRLSLTPSTFQTIVGKYEGVAQQIAHSSDPLPLAAKFVTFTLDASEKAGVSTIRVGLPDPTMRT